MDIRKRKGGVVYRDEYMSEGFAPVTVTLYPGDRDTVRVDEIEPDGTPGNELNMFTPDDPDYAKVRRYVTHTRGKAKRKPPKKRATTPSKKRAKKAKEKATLRERAACLRRCIMRDCS